MTDLALITDHTEQALDLLISQYKELPRLSGLISAITNRLQEFEDTNWDVLNKRLLDYTDRNGNPAHAVGAQLNTIGRLVGRPRNGQDDATYLIYIRAQIFLNKSRARRGQIIKLLQLLDPTAFVYTEYYPCTILIAFADSPATTPRILTELARRAVTGGVRLLLTSPPPTVVAAGVFTLRYVGATGVPALGFGHAGSTAYGGVLAAEYE
jgi:hypothetical protein